jgi:hypothetical protein
MPFFITAEKDKYDEDSFSLPNGQWYTGSRFPPNKRYYVTLRVNGGTKDMAEFPGLSEYLAKKICKWINGRNK